MILQPDTLTRLIAADKDVVGGVYIQRNDDSPLPEVWDELGRLMPVGVKPEVGLRKVLGIGFGCVLTKCSVLVTVGYPQFEYKPALDHDCTVSEDWDFCCKARENGYEVWVDCNVRPGHKGTKIYNA